MDEVVTTLKNQSKAVDEEIKAKELLLERQEKVNRSLLQMLIKSEPVDPEMAGVWTSAKQQPMVNIASSRFTFPSALRNTWIPCPFRKINQWTHIVRDRLIMGVEIDNQDSDKVVSDIHGSVLAVTNDGVQWLGESRSFLLQFGRKENLFPRETNVLRPSEKALLVVSATAPPNLLSSDVILVGHASVADNIRQAEKMLPPVLEPSRWAHWSGELSRASKDRFDPAGDAAPMIRTVVEAFGEKSAPDKLHYQRIVASIYSCQEQKRVRLSGAGQISAKTIFENPHLMLVNCQNSHDEAKYCTLPLFDGITIFSESGVYALKQMEVEFLASGWSSEQIEQFLTFLDSLFPGSTLTLLEDDDTEAVSSEEKVPDYQDVMRKLGLLTSSGMDLGADDPDGTVDGQDYRTVRLDICASEILRFL